MSNLDAREKEFAEGVAQTAEYHEFQTAVDAYHKDEEALELLQKFQTAQEQAQKFEPWGGGSTGDEEDLETLQAKVLAQPMLARYFRSQETLLQALQETNRYMADKLGFDFAGLTRPAGGCC
ncbi:MAG: YlbF family regulator [Spirochaetia bacterium]|nr:YlbF family regulator [Spirochaetia bacterium]